MPSPREYAEPRRGAWRPADPAQDDYCQLSDMGEPLALLGRPVERRAMAARGWDDGALGALIPALARARPVTWLAVIVLIAVLFPEIWRHVTPPLP